ncbi:endo-1,4-beta-xylanase [Singulisphaera rosea]
MLKRVGRSAFVLLAALIGLEASTVSAAEPWSVERANAWASEKPWLVGANFAPAYAINQLEMWQADTFDLKAIDRELALAEGLGFNSLRVFLHHLLWEQDSAGFLRRMEQFLEVAEKHKIGVMFVLLDSVWDPHPRSGKQREPKRGLHNSGWLQSPGVEILKNPARHAELEPYIKGVVGHFRNDRRVHAWDIINEPDNRNNNSYGRHEPENKGELALKLMTHAFAWARSAEPSQPITAGIWIGDWAHHERLKPWERFSLEQSDIITFHNYAGLSELKGRVEHLKRYKRPIICTEYMARPAGSRFDPILAYFKEEKIGAYNWGFVSGKSQTIYPWDSWQKAYDAEPPTWFHDIFRQDGTPYDPKEVDYIRRITGVERPRGR